MGVLSVLVLTLSDQVLEVHRVLTQERAQNAFNCTGCSRWHRSSPCRWCCGRWRASTPSSLPRTFPARRGGPSAVQLDAEVGPAPGGHAAAAGRRARHLAEPPAQSRRRRDAGLARRSLEDHRPAQEGLHHRQPHLRRPGGWRVRRRRAVRAQPGPARQRPGPQARHLQQLDALPPGHPGLDRPADPRSRAPAADAGLDSAVRAVDGQPRRADGAVRALLPDFRRADPGHDRSSC